VAGPVTAMALQRVGIDADVYEAYPTTAHGVGAFMGLAANGLDALNALDLREPVQAVGVPTPKMAMLNGAGKVLAAIANGLTLPDGTTNLTVKRADLYQVLHDEAVRRGVPIEYGKRLIGVDETADGVVARFSDGTEAAGSLLIGADGMRSKVRSLVDPEAPKPEYAGIVGTGGYAHGVRVDADPGTMYFAFGKRAFFGYQVVGEDETWWFANVPEPTEKPATEVPPAETKRRLAGLFADDGYPAERIIEASTETATWLPTHSMAAPASWHRGRTVLVGDAAHVTSPSSGQGASMAIEDAVILARCLRDLPDPAEAFTTYQRLREERVHRVYANAKKLNASKAAGPVGRVFRDLLMPVFAKKMAKPDAIAWLHGYHIEFDEPVTSELAAA
jgi:FAD-dependent urate hydroxylase